MEAEVSIRELIVPKPIPTWTMVSALHYIRALQPRAMDTGWCLLLGGGVLNRGFSRNDLDLLAYPRGVKSRRHFLLNLLPNNGTWSRIEGVSDVYTFVDEGRTIDLIFQTRQEG